MGVRCMTIILQAKCPMGQFGLFYGANNKNFERRKKMRRRCRMSKHGILIICLVPAALFLATTQTFALPVSWTFNNVVFTDGTHLTGSFVYDESTGSLSAFSIHTEGGSLAAAYYESSQPSETSTAVSFNADGLMNIEFKSGLDTDFLLALNSVTTTDGVLSLTPYSIAQESSSGTNEVLLSEGELQGVPVPEPATMSTMLLFGIGLSGIVGFRFLWRKK